MYCLRLELRSMVFFVMLVIPLFNPVAPFLTPNSKACTQNILSILKCKLSRYFSDIYRYFLIFIDNIVKLRQGSGKVRQGKARKGKDGER